MQETENEKDTTVTADQVQKPKGRGMQTSGMGCLVGLGLGGPLAIFIIILDFWFFISGPLSGDAYTTDDLKSGVLSMIVWLVILLLGTGIGSYFLFRRAGSDFVVMLVFSILCTTIVPLVYYFSILSSYLDALK